MNMIFKLENDDIRFLLNSDGTAVILDKKGNTQWEMGPVAIQEYGGLISETTWPKHDRWAFEQFPGRFRVERQGNLLKYCLLDRDRSILGTFNCDIYLEEQWLVFRVRDIDEKLNSLVFPTPIISDSIVIPDGPGRWIRKPGSTMNRIFSPFPCNRYNMRWFGGLKGERGWICIADEGFENSGILINQLCVSPGWVKSLGSWRYTPAVRYRFTDNNYVGMAKAFKSWAIENGLYKSLKEKKEECPYLKNLQGGVMFSPVQAKSKKLKEQLENLQIHPDSIAWKQMDSPVINLTHHDVAGLIKELPSLGVEKGLVVLRGWLYNGFDGRHPDVWPPEPGLGTLEELKSIFNINDNFVVGLHDNYADIYEHAPSFPEGIIRTRDGKRMIGGVWDENQAYVLNYKKGFEYLQRNWENIKTLHPRNMHIDTLTATRPNFENYEQENTMTRMDTLKYKLQLLKFLKDHGQVVGSENGNDFGMQYVDYYGGHIHSQRDAGETVPLLYLVYHDSAFFNHQAPVFTDPFSIEPWWLLHMLWGHLCNYWFRSRSEMELVKKQVKYAQFVTDWHALVGSEEMLSHRFLTEDGQVEKTEFSSGHSVTVNFSNEIRQADGILLTPYGHVIRNL